MKLSLLQLARRLSTLLLVCLVVGVAGTGCNTTRGFGKDVEKAGEKIQDGTK